LEKYLLAPLASPLVRWRTEEISFDPERGWVDGFVADGDHWVGGRLHNHVGDRQRARYLGLKEGEFAFLPQTWVKPDGTTTREWPRADSRTEYHLRRRYLHQRDDVRPGDLVQLIALFENGSEERWK
jgi:hypothetical protein